jgi:hypothetical protein
MPEEEMKKDLASTAADVLKEKYAEGVRAGLKLAVIVLSPHLQKLDHAGKVVLGDGLDALQHAIDTH